MGGRALRDDVGSDEGHSGQQRGDKYEQGLHHDGEQS